MNRTPSSPERVLRALIEYDGSRYRGWQVQINARTVQGELIRVLRTSLGEAVKVHGAGRTDAGVHALGQVASLHFPGGPAPRTPLEALRKELNAKLPSDINILRLRPVPAGFHARHDAVQRVYRYRLSRRRSAFAKPYVYWVQRPLDLGAMRAAASAIQGRHDFASFCDKPEDHDSTIVEVSFVSIEESPEEPDLVLVRIGASHFLWRMVRRVVGTLLEVGQKRLDPGRVQELLKVRSDEPARWTVPPSGLFLESVLYRGEPEPSVPSALRPAF